MFELQKCSIYSGVSHTPDMAPAVCRVHLQGHQLASLQMQLVKMILDMKPAW